MFKNSKYAFGIGLFFTGICFTLINYFAIVYSNYYFPKLLIMGIVVAFMGLGFMLFPGPKNDPSDPDKFFKALWKNSRWLDKLMWILFTAAGAAAAVFVMIHFKLEL